MSRQNEKVADYSVKLCFYVPVEALETVKAAVFDAGAGACSQYHYCAWQTLGEGQFKPLHGSNPRIGVIGSLAVVPEYKVEMLCRRQDVAAIEAALLKAHPYETPAYDFTLLWRPI